MLSTLLLAAAAALPVPQQHAQVRADPAVNLLPAESIAVVELTLEPWDRMRAQTTAHSVLRGRNLLKRRMNHPDFKQHGEVDVVRNIMGSVRISLSATPETLASGCLVLTLDPATIGAAGFDWEKFLKEESSIDPAQVSRGYMALIGDVDPEEDAALLAKLAQRAREKDRVLAGSPEWEALRGPVRSANDMLRASLLTWNWDAETMTTLLSMTGDPSMSMVAPMMAGMVKSMGLEYGAIWTVSIQGDHFVDRQFIARGPNSPNYLAPLGDPNLRLGQMAITSDRFDSVAMTGFEASAMAKNVFAWAEESYTALGMDITSEPEFVEVKNVIMSLAAQLGPRMTTAQDADGWPQMATNLMDIQIRDREAFDAAVAKLPPEFAAVSAMMQMQMQSYGSSGFKLEGNSLRTGELEVGEAGDTLGDQPAFQAASAEMLAFLGDREPLMMGITMPSFDAEVLRVGPSYLADLLEQLGIENFEWGPPVPAETLKELRPTWFAGVRTEQGMLLETHSNFSTLALSVMGLAVGLDQVMAMMGGNPGSDFDEEEF